MAVSDGSEGPPEVPTDDPPPGVDTETKSTTPRFIGDYELLEEFKPGGMGRVFRARQLSAGREVALKVIKSGAFASAEEVRRFQLEARAAATLDHPNIVTVYEMGEYDGQPFFSMRLVEGGSLGDSIAAKNWVASESATEAPGRLRVVERRAATLIHKVALAVHHAHQRGVLHRDIKPSNILLDAAGEPYVTDFGLAKFLRNGVATSLTEPGVGTPAYMPPEQFRGGATPITTAADVYGLGAVLYELLTGTVPSPGEDAVQVMRRVVQEEPKRLRALNPTIAPDLETICLKCLDKEPSGRYSSASELAEDLRNWLENRPIKARPATATERCWKWSRRNPKLAALALAATVILASWVGRELLRAASSRAANRQLKLVNADLALTEGRTAEALETLRALLIEKPDSDAIAARAGSALEYRAWPIRVRTLRRAPEGINALELSPDRRWWVSANTRGMVEFFDRSAENGHQSVRLSHKASVLDKLCFTPESDTLIASGAANEFSVIRLRRGVWELSHTYPLTNSITWMESRARDRLIVADDGGILTLIKLGEPGVVWSRQVHPSPVTAVTISPDSALIASGDSTGNVRVLRLADGEVLGELSAAGGDGIAINALTIDNRNNQVLIAVEAEQLRVWSWQTSGTADMLPLPSAARRIVTTERGQCVVGSADGRMFFVDAHGPNRRCVDVGVRAGGPTMALRTDGELVAQLNANGEAHLLDLARLLPVIEPIPLKPNSQTLALDTSASELVTASSDGRIDVWGWRPASAEGYGIVHRANERTNVNCVAVSTDGRWQASGDEGGTVWLRRGGSSPQERTLKWSGAIQSVAFLESPPRLFVGRFSGPSAVVDLDDPDKPPVPFGPKTGVWSLSVLPEHGIAATLSRDAEDPQRGRPELWSVASNERIATLRTREEADVFVDRLILGPDGSTVIGLNASHLFWWSGHQPPLPAHVVNFSSLVGVGQQPTCCALSTGGGIALVGTIDGVLSWWSQGRTQPLHTVALASISAVGWSPSSSRAFAGLVDGSVYQVEMRAQPKLVGRLNGLVTDLSVSPDGAFLAAATSMGNIKVWHAADCLPVSELFALGAQVFAVRFTPDSSRLLAICNDGSTREYRTRWLASEVLPRLQAWKEPPSSPPTPR